MPQSRRRWTIAVTTTTALLMLGWSTGAAGQDPRPAGRWLSRSGLETANPLMAAAEMYLDITIARDGTFRGRWAEYLCAARIGAFGYTVYHCTLDRGTGGAVSGTIDGSGGGVAELAKWGRHPLVVKPVDSDEFVVELPQGWRGQALEGYRARLRRQGAPAKPIRPESPQRPTDTDDSGEVLSANALFREFATDATAAERSHIGKVMTLEGRVSAEVIMMSDGSSAAVHISDGFRSNALILEFPDRKDVAGVTEKTKLRFRCTVKRYEYEILWLDQCSIVR
jgi:hypothetical protein